MITALVCVSGLAVLELYVIVVMGIWTRMVNKENRDLSEKVDRGELTPKDLDNKIAGFQKEIRELKHIRMMDMATIVELRRQVELLVRRDEDATA